MVFVTGDTHGDPNRLSKNHLKCLNEGERGNTTSAL